MSLPDGQDARPLPDPDTKIAENEIQVTQSLPAPAGSDVPRLVLETEDELRRYQDAEERRKARMLLARSQAARQV